MKPDLMRYLSCPDCFESFEIEEAMVGADGHDIRSGILRCRCASYPIMDSLPRFCREDYAESFGLEWSHYRKTQLDREGQNNSEARFRSEIGFSLEQVAGRLVLDAGCGMGRFADVVSRYGGIVVGVDMSVSIEAAFENIGQRPNVHLIQANIAALPFKPGTFDYIYSIGVLHHTPDPPYFFGRLLPLLKPGGAIAVCVYSREISTFALAKRKLYRALFRRLSKPALLALSRRLGLLGYELAKIPMLRKTLALFPAVVYPEKPKEWSALDTFDFLSPVYEFRYTAAEVYRWFQDGGIDKIRVIPGIPGWVCITGVLRREQQRDERGRTHEGAVAVH